MIFDSVEEALHYAAGLKLEVILYKNKVIDVTEFKFSHPGGQEVIDALIKKDATKEFDKVESHNTKSTFKEMDRFTIGEIKTDSTGKTIDHQVTRKNKIDFKKGLIWQVITKLNKQEYIEFIHDPTHMINPPDAILFDSKFLELFTKTKWWYLLIIYIPLALWFLKNSLEIFSVPLLLFLIFVGFAFWSITEYTLHRFLFHSEDKIPGDSSFFILIHFFLHGIHHGLPMDRYRLVFPPTLAIPFYFGLRSLIDTLFGFYAPGVTIGFLIGYLNYDLTHYFLHHSTPKSNYYTNLKKAHIIHHYKEPERGYGVSLKIWDHVFNTLSKIRSNTN